MIDKLEIIDILGMKPLPKSFGKLELFACHS